METIVITGGAGYIGSHTIIEILEKTSFRIISIDNHSKSKPQVYDHMKKVAKRDFETICVDLCDEHSTFKALDGIGPISGIIHFAAFKSVPESTAEPLLYYQNNLQSLTNLLKYCRVKKISNFIFSSSCSVYGNSTDLPVTEQSPLNPAVSPYAHTKQIGEDIIRFYCEAEKWFTAIALRYFNPVGAHMSGLLGEMPQVRPDNLLPVLTQTAVGKNKLTVFGTDYDTRDGSCIRDYIHVTDIADAHIKALNYLLEKKQEKNYDVFNLGTGEGVTVLEVIASFEKMSGKKLEFAKGGRRNGDVIAVYANNSKAKTKLGWNPVFSLDDMTSSAWKWQQTLLNTFVS